MHLLPMPFAFRVYALSILALVFASAPLSAGAEDPGTDSFGVTATRILSLGPDVTEIIYALGAGDRIVAVDRSSRYPSDTSTKQNVGYRRSLSAEGLVSLQPDLIVAAQDIGPPEVVDVLKNLKIPVVFVPEDNSERGVLRKIEIIARVLGRTTESRALARQVSDDFARTRSLVAGMERGTPKRAIFLHGLLRLTAAGGDTAAGAIIALAGAVNPLADVRGYKALSEEALLTLAPDTILMLADGKGGPTPEEVFATPALRNTPAALTRSLIVLDGPYMLGFGPRTATAISDLAAMLYPRKETD